MYVCMYVCMYGVCVCMFVYIYNYIYIEKLYFYTYAFMEKACGIAMNSSMARISGFGQFASHSLQRLEDST